MPPRHDKAPKTMHFIYIKVPIGTDFEGRDRFFHEGLEATLTEQRLGSILGWGGSLADPDGREPARVAFHRIDIEVTDVTSAVVLLRRALDTLGAPEGTEVHYVMEGAALQDIFTSTGWRTEPCSTTTHRRKKPS